MPVIKSSLCAFESQVHLNATHFFHPSCSSKEFYSHGQPASPPSASIHWTHICLFTLTTIYASESLCIVFVTKYLIIFTLYARRSKCIKYVHTHTFFGLHFFKHNMRLRSIIRTSNACCHLILYRLPLSMIAQHTAFNFFNRLNFLLKPKKYCKFSPLTCALTWPLVHGPILAD